MSDHVEKPEINYKRDVYYEKFYGKGISSLVLTHLAPVHLNFAGTHKTKEDEVMVVSVAKSVKKGFYPALTTDKKGTVYFKIDASQLSALKKDIT